jgi:uncharacterized protein YktB (UPF0637 family)
MAFSGFSPEDFLYFMDSDQFALVEYIRDSLHPRLREFGLALAAELGKQLNVEFRAQLRSGRWWKHPWATWTSLILPDERQRSDNRRPRLSVFVAEEECMVGFMHNVWRPRWKRLAKRPEGLVRAIDKAASGRPRLQLALAHWEKNAENRWERRTTLCKTATELLALAAERGQDFVVVGRAYPFPKEVDLLTSPEFPQTALAVLKRAWPVYRYAFEQGEGA